MSVTPVYGNGILLVLMSTARGLRKMSASAPRRPKKLIFNKKKVQKNPPMKTQIASALLVASMALGGTTVDGRDRLFPDEYDHRLT